MSELTLLFPLHKANSWLERVSRNIRHSPKNSTIIISDQTHLDDSITILKKEHKNDSRIIFLEQKGEAGWREHINYLLPKVNSTFFSIMAQDDSFDAGYYEALLKAAKDTRRSSVTFAPILAHNIPGQLNAVRFEELPKTTLKKEPWEYAVEYGTKWNLGIAYRGVIRTKFAKNIISTDRDRFADVVWVFGLALRGVLVEVPSVFYNKYYHPDSVHATWTPLTNKERYLYFSKEVKRYCTLRPWKARKILDKLKEALNV